MNKNLVFLYLLFSFSLGIVCTFLIPISFTHTPILILLLLVFIFSFVLKIRYTLLVGISLFGFALGVLRGEYSESQREVISTSIEEQDTYLLEVVSDPVRGEFNQKFEARIVGNREAKVLVRAPYYPELLYGDMVTLKSQLKIPESFETESGRLFDYKKYLEKDYIFYVLSPREVTIISRGNGNFFIENLLLLKKGVVEKLDQVVGQPASGLLAGVTIGSEEGLGEEREKQFRKTGVVHIIVLSGYNVTLVAESFSKSLSYVLPRTLALSGGLLGIILFVLMTGGGATIIRASIMSAIVVIGKLIYRTPHTGRVLLTAGTLMVMHNPYILLYDPSFQLSFLATLGILYIAPLVERKLHWISLRWLRELVSGTLGTQIVVLPLLIFMSGEISLISLLSNILVVPIVPILMSLAAVTAVLSFIFSPIAYPFAFLGNLFSHYVFKVVELFSNIPFASLHTPQVSAWVVVCIYVLGVVIYIQTHKTRGSESQI